MISSQKNRNAFGWGVFTPHGQHFIPCMHLVSNGSSLNILYGHSKISQFQSINPKLTQSTIKEDQEKKLSKIHFLEETQLRKASVGFATTHTMAVIGHDFVSPESSALFHKRSCAYVRYLDPKKAVWYVLYLHLWQAILLLPRWETSFVSNVSSSSHKTLI